MFNTLLDKLEGGGASSTARLAIGQAVAILFELGREVDSDLLESAESCETYSLIEQLATESNRYTARKERNQLRAHFRDVLQTLNVRWLASYMSHVLHHMLFEHVVYMSPMSMSSQGANNCSASPTQVTYLPSN